MVNRRQVLLAGGVGLGVLAAPKLLSPAAGAATQPGGHTHPAATAPAGPPPAFVPFSARMPLPQQQRPFDSTGGVDRYRVDITPATAELIPGVGTPVLTYGGQFTGPLIRATTGRPVEIRFTNRLTGETNVHLHGGHTPAASDGHPSELIRPGGSRTYRYPNKQQGATLWFHDHSHHNEAEYIYRGLHALYVIDDPAEQRLGLPGGDYDVPIMVRDGHFDEQGGLFFDYENPANRSTILVNGKAQPYFPVVARKYRFRLLNAANDRIFTLRVGDGTPVQQIASDGGLLPAPVTRTEFAFGSAERVEIVVDFSAFPVGSQVYLSDATMGNILRFDVVGPAIDHSRVPPRLRALPMRPAAGVTRDVRFSFDFSVNPPVGLMNGKTYDENRVDFVVERGATEVWTIYNDDAAVGLNHSFHMHLVQFQVLDRDGGAPPTPDDAGLKDTIFVGPGKSVRVLATFTDYVGRYLYHCHYNEHSTLGMMAQMDVVA